MTSFKVTDEIRNKIRGLRPGDSFFVPGVRAMDLVALQQAGYKLNIKLEIRTVEEDPVWGEFGTRVTHRGPSNGSGKG